jgi:hypothetical protein
MEFWEFWREHWEYIIQGGVLVMENLVSRGPIQEITGVMEGSVRILSTLVFLSTA